jgi:hypothetical protein
MQRRAFRLKRSLTRAAVLSIAIFVVGMITQRARADEGGVSFWLPGIYGSLAAVPLQPGWSFATFNYYTAVSASGDVARAREVETGRFPLSFSGTVNLNLNADADLQAFNPSYVFATPLLGGQASIGLMAPVGRNNASVAGTLNGTITGREA